MSFPFMRNSKGLRMDPCGIPHIVIEGSEQQFSKFTLNNRFGRYNLNQSIA